MEARVRADPAGRKPGARGRGLAAAGGGALGAAAAAAHCAAGGPPRGRALDPRGSRGW